MYGYVLPYFLFRSAGEEVRVRIRRKANQLGRLPTIVVLKRAILALDRSKSRLATFGTLWLVLTVVLAILLPVMLSHSEPFGWESELRALQITGLSMSLIMWALWRRDEIVKILTRLWNAIVAHWWSRLVSWIQGAED